jgi:dipeptidyl aminopeptidase/acylaminoacyl peptidase
MTHVDASDPPMLLVHGTADTLVPIAQAESLNAALEAAGVEHELISIAGGGHGIRQPRVYLQIAAFFDKHLGGKSAAVLEELYRNRGVEPDKDPPARPLQPADEE